MIRNAIIISLSLTMPLKPLVSSGEPPDLSNVWSSQRLTRDERQLLERKYGGKDGYQDHERARVVGQKGLSPILYLFQLQDELFRVYTTGLISNREREHASEEELLALEKRAAAHTAAWIALFYKKIVPLAIAVAPSDQTVALEEKASDTYAQFARRFPGGIYDSASQKDVELVDKVCEEITSQLQSLPQLSPRDIQAEFDSLPREELTR